MAATGDREKCIDQSYAARHRRLCSSRRNVAAAIFYFIIYFFHITQNDSKRFHTISSLSLHPRSRRRRKRSLSSSSYSARHGFRSRLLKLWWCLTVPILWIRRGTYNVRSIIPMIRIRDNYFVSYIF